MCLLLPHQLCTQTMIGVRRRRESDMLEVLYLLERRHHQGCVVDDRVWSSERSFQIRYKMSGSKDLEIVHSVNRILIPHYNTIILLWTVIWILLTRNLNRVQELSPLVVGDSNRCGVKRLIYFRKICLYE